ncbi:glycoside hydrolase [Arthrospira sp. PCC 8006]|uniref:glycoside hydrolase family 24 protein n=1 Tax=Oscillatoriales TaxID=1150 RepID=UPI00396DF6DD
MHESRPPRRRDRRVVRSKTIAGDDWTPEMMPSPLAGMPYRRTRRRGGLLKPLLLSFLLLWGVGWLWGEVVTRFGESRVAIDHHPSNEWPPLVMRGGDPYIRSLMRTISASESNYRRPYHVIYGGKYVSDLSRHPDRCVTIVAGPNKGKCTTAAGRYQFLSSTWEQMADRYHPKPARFWYWHPYSFEAEYQDIVVYRWLLDQDFWGVDISQMLQEGRLNEVLKLLSGTWTSLGYGIEDNMMTSSLPRVYEQVLQEELYLNGVKAYPFHPQS